MPAMIKSPTKCKECAVIRLFQSKNYSVVTTHRELCTLQGLKVQEWPNKYLLMHKWQALCDHRWNL